MFKPGDRVKRITKGSRGTVMGRVYTVVHYDAVSDLLRIAEVPGKFAALRFVKYKGKKKLEPKKEQYSKYFVARDTKLNKVCMYDLKTKKVVESADDIALFFCKEKTLNGIKGYVGYPQDNVTPEFLKEYMDYLGGTPVKEYNHKPKGMSNFCVIRMDSYINFQSFEYSDNITGIKGLALQHWKEVTDV